MAEDFVNEQGYTPEEEKARRERTLKLITILFMGAILMLFVGLISAVIVSKMDGFWVNLKLPSAFYWSTLTILLSSLTFIVGKKFAQSNNQGGLKAMISSTLVLGMGFMYLQFQGWKQLVESGNMVTGGIYFDKGAYGDRFVLLSEGAEVHFDGDKYTVEGDTLNEKQVEELKEFINPICLNDRKFVNHPYELMDYEAPYSIGLVSKSSLKPIPLQFQDGKLYNDGVEVSLTDRSTLFAFAFGIKNETAFFGMRGKYGEDFTVSLNGEVLDFIDRKLYFPSFELNEEQISDLEAKHFEGGKEYIIKGGKVYSEGEVVKVDDFHFENSKTGVDYYILNDIWYQVGEEISAGQYNKFYQASNTASSYIYVLSAMHGIHILFGFGLLLVLLVRSFKGYYNSEHIVGLKVGGYFWHFLGVLWIGLFFFWMSITI
ncbi:MAG: cytochrome c oxidase subunit 3 [Flavobacteriales bacterium]|nr:cytochrome c oxidase subunit 3 [Flavobacteriales bacterium]